MGNNVMCKRKAQPNHLLTVAIVLLLPASSISAKSSGTIPSTAEQEINELKERVEKLYQAGRYREAIPLAQKALDLAETALGPEHPYVAASLYNLAGLYNATGQYAEAEASLQRRLAIVEKLGRDHPFVATSLDDLADLHTETGQYAKAEP